MGRTMSVLLAAVSTAAMAATYEDDFISLNLGSAVRQEVSDGYVYTLSTAGGAQVTLKRPAYFNRALVVGGGGGGGGVIAGGGGGGGVVEINGGDTLYPADTSWTANIGGGGFGSGNWQRGGKGGNTTLTLDGEHSYVAYGGGGGGGWNAPDPDAFAYYDPAATGGGAGANWRDQRRAPFELTEEAINAGKSAADFQGGYGGAAIGGNGGSSPGGGGGAAYSGGDGIYLVDGANSGKNRAGDGGQGRSSDIRELTDDYFGGGGGGGGGNNCDYGGRGGLGGGGRGTDCNIAEPQSVRNGEDGRGGGGGGGAFSENASLAGGNGGSGCIILRFKYANVPGLIVGANIPESLVSGALSPAFGFHEMSTDDTATLTAATADGYTVTGCIVEEMGADGQWGAGVQHSGATLAYTQSANLTRVTWQYDISQEGPEIVATRSETKLEWMLKDVGRFGSVVTSATMEWSDSDSYPSGSTSSENIITSATTVPAKGTIALASAPETLYVRITAQNDAGGESVREFSLQAPTQGARVIFVSPYGDNTNGTGSEANPYLTLRKAIAVAEPGDTIKLLPGVFAVDEETPFPINTDVTIEGSGEASVVDGENAVDNIFVSTGTGTLKNLVLRNSLADAVVASGTDFTVEDVKVEQSRGSFFAAGGFAFVGACHAVVRRCTFEGMRRLGFIGQIGADANVEYAWSLLVQDCVFRDLIVGGASIYTANQLQKEGVHYSGRHTCFNITVEDCLFEGISSYRGADDGNFGDDVLGDAFPAAALNICSGWDHRGYASVSRCRFDRNTAASLFGTQNAGVKDANNPVLGLLVSDCLFTDNSPRIATAAGFNTRMLYRNCTFVNGGIGNYVARDIAGTFQNCVFDNAGPMVNYTGHSWNGAQSIGNAVIGKAAFRNFEAGVAAAVDYDSANVVVGDPLLDDDYVPLPYSPLIDAGDNEGVPSVDLVGNPRTADNNADGTKTVDIGCRESTFWDSPFPTVRVSAPGLLSLVKGGTATFEVSISAIPQGASGPFAVTLDAPDTFVVSPTSFSIAGLGATQTVTVSVPADAAGSGLLAIGASAEGFAPAEMAVSYDALKLEVAGGTRQFVRAGTDYGISVSLTLEGAVPGSDVAIAAAVVSGNSTVAWSAEGANIIAAAAHATAGTLVVSPVAGTSVIRFTTPTGVFEETGTATLDVTVVAGDGRIAVNPVDGDDATAEGTAEHPFKTIESALAFASAGDTLVLAPGSYTASSWPIRPHGVALVGMNGDSPAAVGDVVIDANNTAENLIAYSAADAGLACRIANLTLRASTKAAVSISSADVAVENCDFTQSGANGGEVGGVHVMNDSHVTISGCSFHDMYRMAAVLLQSADTASDDTRSVTVSGCSFVDGTYEAAALANFKAYDVSAKFALTVEDCVFERNTTPEGKVQHDAYAGSAILFHANGASYTTLRIARCLFRQNVGGVVLGLEGFDTGNNSANPGPVISDCVFDGNTPRYAMANGYSVRYKYANCTFKGNTTGVYNGRFIDPTFQNCLFVGDGPISGYQTSASGAKGDWANSIGNVTFLGKNLVYETPYGVSGKITMNAADVIEAEPIMDGYALRPYSPGVDAGDNECVVSTTDFAGNKRVAHNTSGASAATVDIGAFECAYGDPTVLSPILPFPGLAPVAIGGSVTIAVTAGPAAEWPVTVDIEYPSGITGPDSVQLTSADPVEVTVTATTAVEGLSRLVFSIEDGGSTVYDLEVVDISVKIAGKKRVHVRTGASVDLPVSMAQDGFVAPEAIEFTVGTPSGGSAAEWTGAASIAQGAAASAGALHVTAGQPGVTTIRFSAGVPFVESGSTDFDLEIVAYDGNLYVDSADGSDETGTGLESAPFKTIALALSCAQPGDTVRLAAGTYDAASGETFPIHPATVAIVGAGADSTTIDAGDSSLFVVEWNGLGTEVSGRVAGVTLAHSTGPAVSVSGSSALLEAVEVVQTASVTNITAGGGVSIGGDSFVEVKGCRFAGFGRRYAICAEGGLPTLHGRRVTVVDTVFENLYCGVAPVAVLDGAVYDLAVTNCTFSGNSTPIVSARDTNDPAMVSDAYAASAMFLRCGDHNKILDGQNIGFRCGTVTIDRCRFEKGNANHVIGCAYASWPYSWNGSENVQNVPEGELDSIEISNSLFADCASAACTIYGYSTDFSFRNCTFANLPDGGLCGRVIKSRLYNCVVTECGPINAHSRAGNIVWWEHEGANGTATLHRTLVWHTVDGADATDAANVTRPDDDCLSVDPQLRADYVPLISSPVKNIAVAAEVRGEFDLSGGTRRKGNVADLGCFETATGGFAITVR